MLVKYGIFERFFIKWQTRALGGKINKLLFLIPILACMSKENLDKNIQNIKKILEDSIKQKNLSELVFKRVIMQIGEYLEDSELLEEDKERFFELLSQNIQMFGIVVDILGEDTQEFLDIKKTIRDRYDKKFSLSMEESLLLDYQERQIY